MEGVPRKSVCHPRHHLFHLYNSMYINGVQDAIYVRRATGSKYFLRPTHGKLLI